MSRLLVIGLALLSTVSALSCRGTGPEGPGPHSARPGRPFLWEIEAASSRKPSYLLGTYVAASIDDVASWVPRQMARCDTILLETAELSRVERRRQADELQRYFELERGRSLQDMLDKYEYFDLQGLLGVPSGTLAKMKPWVALLRLMRTARPVHVHDPGLEEQLAVAARKRGIEVGALETWHEQVDFLDRTIGAGELSAAIRDYPQIPGRIRIQHDLYRAGDDRLLGELTPSSTDPIVARGAKLAARLVRHMETSECVFAVVALAHLTPGAGLLPELRRLGRRATRVSGREPPR